MAQYPENNIYNYQDEDMYSEYPTDRNKYESKTGPFEGFFLRSVATKIIEKIEIEVIIKQEHKAQ
ncbi:MAG: hypothetical protein ACRD8K_09040 [Nitrososphaeraceae archaeon]